MSSRFGEFLRALSGRPAQTLPAARAYDGAATGRTAGWLRSSYDANSEIALGLAELVKSSRDLQRNNPWGARIIDADVNAGVGDGIRPTVRTGDKDLDARVYDLWEAWGARPIAGATMTVYGWQRLMWRAMDSDGDALSRIRPRFAADMPGLPPFKIQPIESDLLPVDLSRAVANSLNVIYAGIEFDALGEVAGYHLYRQHPGSNLQTVSGSPYETIRIPAASMIHAFEIGRPGQVRGVPLLSPVILALWDLAGYQDAVRVAARAAACMVATVTGGDGDAPIQPDGLSPETDDAGAVVTDSHGTPVEGLEPGRVLYAPDGKEIKVHSPTAPQGVSDVVSDSLHAIAAGVGLSYHVLSGDMSDSSFAQAKLGLIEQGKRINARRRLVFVPQVLDPLWRNFIDFSIAAGLLPNNPLLYRVRWSDPKQQAADRYDEAKAAQLEIRLGMRSEPEVIESDYGRDPDDVLAEQAEWAAKKRAAGIVTDGDPSQTTLNGSVQGNVPGLAPPTDDA